MRKKTSNAELTDKSENRTALGPHSRAPSISRSRALGSIAPENKQGCPLAITDPIKSDYIFRRRAALARESLSGGASVPYRFETILEGGFTLRRF